MKGIRIESFRNPSEILALAEPVVSISAVVSDKSIARDENGNKIHLAGTIVGGIGGRVLRNQRLHVAPHGGGRMTTGLVGNNNNLLFVAQTNTATSIEYIDPGAPSTALSAAVSGSDVVVTLATNADGDIISTANDVKAKINATVPVHAVIEARSIPGESGAGIVTAMSATTLPYHNDVTQAEGVLLNDVDVTDGPTSAAMLIHGFAHFDSVRPTPAQETTMPGIMFIDYRN